MNNKNTIIFILAAGRSGSTLTDKLLGTHTKCFSLGEIGEFSDYFRRNVICSCGAHLRQCNVWEGLNRAHDFE